MHLGGRVARAHIFTQHAANEHTHAEWLHRSTWESIKLYLFKLNLDFWFCFSQHLAREYRLRLTERSASNNFVREWFHFLAFRRGIGMIYVTEILSSVQTEHQNKWFMRAKRSDSTSMNWFWLKCIRSNKQQNSDYFLKATDSPVYNSS